MTKKALEAIILTLSPEDQAFLATVPDERKGVFVEGIASQTAKVEESSLKTVPDWLMHVLVRCRQKLLVIGNKEKGQLKTEVTCTVEDHKLIRYAYRTHLELVANTYGDDALRAYARTCDVGDKMEIRMGEGSASVIKKLRAENPRGFRDLSEAYKSA